MRLDSFTNTNVSERKSAYQMFALSLKLSRGAAVCLIIKFYLKMEKNGGNERNEQIFGGFSCQETRGWTRPMNDFLHLTNFPFIFIEIFVTLNVGTVPVGQGETTFFWKSTLLRWLEDNDLCLEVCCTPLTL